MKTKPSIHFNFSPTGTQQLEPHSYPHMYNNLFLVNGFGEGNGTHSSTLAWKIPWTEEPGGLQSMGSRRVGHD